MGCLSCTQRHWCAAMVFSAHLWHSVDSLQPVHCSWMGFAGFASPSLWLGKLSGWKSYVCRIRATKGRRLERTFSRNAQSNMTLACTVLTARGQFTLQAERARTISPKVVRSYESLPNTSAKTSSSLLSRSSSSTAIILPSPLTRIG